MPIFQVVDDQLRQVRVVRPLEPAEEVASPVRAQVLSYQEIQRGVLEPVQVAVSGVCYLHEGRAAEEVLVQPGGEVRLLVQHLLLVVETQAEPVLDEIQGTLGVLVVSQQRLTIADFLDPRRVAVPLDPCPQHLVNLTELTLMLVVKAMVVVVIFRSRDELLQRDGAVLRQTEVLKEADLPAWSDCGPQEQTQCRCFHEVFHGFLLVQWK